MSNITTTTFYNNGTTTINGNLVVNGQAKFYKQPITPLRAYYGRYHSTQWTCAGVTETTIPYDTADTAFTTSSSQNIITYSSGTFTNSSSRSQILFVNVWLCARTLSSSPTTNNIAVWIQGPEGRLGQQEPRMVTDQSGVTAGTVYCADGITTSSFLELAAGASFSTRTWNSATGVGSYIGAGTNIRILVLS